MKAYRGGSLEDLARKDGLRLSASPDPVVAARYLEYRRHPVIFVFDVDGEAARVIDFSADHTCPEVLINSSALSAICDPLAIRAIADRAEVMPGGFAKWRIRVARDTYREYSRSCPAHQCTVRLDGSCPACQREVGGV